MDKCSMKITWKIFFYGVGQLKFIQYDSQGLSCYTMYDVKIFVISR